jgi:hypothetical protein
MEINWGLEIGGILTALVVFFISKNFKSKFSEKEIQIFNRIPRQYLFFLFAAAFFGVSIVVDFSRLFTDRLGLCISFKYLLPLSTALATYLKLKQASKAIESDGGKALAS